MNQHDKNSGESNDISAACNKLSAVLRALAAKEATRVNKTVVFSEKDKRNLREMASVLPLAPYRAAEILDYAYGLGFCQGAIVTATDILSKIPDSTDDASCREEMP